MNRLRELRQNKQMRQADLAALLNTKPQTISRYEIGERGLDVETIQQLCDIFDCTADYLLGRSLLPSADLTEGEAELLLAYRSADPNIQAGIRALLQPYIEKDANNVS